MGQTLTHGVYLPDEGERNCYAGLAANWQLLDNSVGTVAEHTTALAGKAPLVHTHTKADITDFPAYGNSAGTICEGNDSRLSDARTPVAHTHTKSDVTDLFNSANTWANEQTCKSNNPKWINKNNNITIGVAPASNQTCAFYNYDKNGNEIGRLVSRVQPDGKTLTWLAATNLYKNGALDPTGSTIWSLLQCCINPDGYAHVLTNCDFIPADGYTNINLGTSTNKWKSLNGINPGALSIFNPSATPDPISFPNGVNESGTWKYDGSAWNVLDVSNIGDGWIIITYNACAAGDYILARFVGTGGSRYPSMIFKAEILAGSPTSAYIYAFFPVAKAFGNIYLEMKINSNANLVLHHFMPAYGTV